MFTWLETLGKEMAVVGIISRDSSGKLAGCLPLFEIPAIKGKGLWPFCAQSADNFSPLLENPESPALVALLGGVQELLSHYHFVWLPLLHQNTVESHWLPNCTSLALHPKIRERTETRLLEVPSISFEEFSKETMGKKSRQNLRRAERQLKEQGTLLHETFQTPEAVRKFFPEMVSLEHISWKGENGLGIFSKAEITSFYAKLLPAAADAGELRLSALRLNEYAIAFEIAFIHKDYYGIHSQSFLPDYQKYSPGKQLLMRNYQWAFEHHFKVIDFMQGDIPFKERITNRHEKLIDLSFFAPTRIGRFHRWLTTFFSRSNHFWPQSKGLAQLTGSRTSRENRPRPPRS